MITKTRISIRKERPTTIKTNETVMATIITIKNNDDGSDNVNDYAIK
jgi:hypothetical protein